VTPRNVNASLGEIPACDSLLWSHQQPEEKPDEFYLSTFDRPNHKRRALAPNQRAAFEAFSKAAFADGALSEIQADHRGRPADVTQCPYCIDGHTKAFFRAGASPEELMEAIWVAAEMRAGGAYAHSTLMLATLADEEERKRRSAP